MDVFVSRPTWVPLEMERGLRAFTSKLEDLELNPRTLGTTDYPTKSPLDEVIRIMDECAGVVVLGYPQIVIEAGYVKDNAIDTSLALPTEWNHIEAGLAYSRGLPMVVIHHVGVCRGIFDRGALNSFIFEQDLSDSAWPSTEEISGALRAWKTEVLKRPDSSTQADSIGEQIRAHMNDIWSIFGIGRKIDNPKPRGDSYREKAECRVLEANEFYIRVKILSSDNVITIPRSDFILSYDDKCQRLSIEVRKQ